MTELWRSANGAAQYGETLTRMQLRLQILTSLEDTHRHDWSAPEVMGQFSIDPSKQSFVADVLKNPVQSPETDAFEAPPPILEEWELDAVIDLNGEEHTEFVGWG